MKSLSLITTIFSLLFVTWVCAVWMDPDRVCLDSPMVSHLSVETSSGEGLEVPECFLLSRLIQPDLEPENQLLLKLFLKKLRKMDASVMLFSSNWDPVEVQLSFFQPFVLKTEHNKIEFGAELLRSPGNLEKAILQEVLQSMYSTSDRYVLEIVSDFVTSVVLNRWWRADKSSRDIKPSGSFLSHIVSFRDYCYSNLKSIFHWEYCINQNSLLEVTQSAPGLKDITIWGLREYFGLQLWKSYQSQGLSEKRKVFDRVLLNLKTDKLEYPSEIGSLKDLAKWSSDYLYKISDQRFEEKKFLQIPLVVDFSDLPGGTAELPLIPENMFKSRSLYELLLKNKWGVTHIPSYRKLSVEINDLKVQYYILPSCREYSFSELAKYDAEKVIVLEGCEAVNFNWVELLKKDLVRYLRGTNKKFAVFHSSSLKFALRKGIVGHLDKFKFSEPEALRKRFLWDGLVWNKQFLAYQPLSDINMITLFR